MRRYIVALSVLAIGLTAVIAQDAKDSEKAASTRKLLDTKISVDYKDTLMQDVVKDLAEQVKSTSKKELPTKLDVVSGLSQNTKVTHEAKDKTLAVVLDELGKKYDIGYVVVSGSYKSGPKMYGKEFDGVLLIRKSGERGFPEKK